MPHVLKLIIDVLFDGLHDLHYILWVIWHRVYSLVELAFTIHCNIVLMCPLNFMFKPSVNGYIHLCICLQYEGGMTDGMTMPIKNIYLTINQQIAKYSSKFLLL